MSQVNIVNPYEIILEKVLAPCLLIGASLVILAKVLDISSINLLLIPLGTGCLLKTIFSTRARTDRPLRLDFMDVSISVVALVEIATYYMSSYRANSFPHLIEVLALTTFYYLIKLNVKYEYQRTVLYSVIAILGLLLSCLAITVFIVKLGQLESAGFSDPTEFRHLLNFAGPLIGEIVTLYLMLLPFPFIMFLRNKEMSATTWLWLVPALTLLLAIAISFSRGAYVAIVAFFITCNTLLYIYRLVPLTRLIKINTLLGCVLLLTLTPVIKPIVSTLNMFGTPSQVRSVEGRKDLWQQSLEIVKDHPVCGIGAYNFPIHYMAYKAQDEDSPFVGRTFNFILQLLVEKGLLGLLAYCLLFLAFYYASYRKMLQSSLLHQRTAILLVAACTSVFIRDLTYSSMLSHTGVSLLLWFSFAINSQNEHES